MRIQAAVVVLILTLVISVHVTGQQEALPAVKARATSADATSLSVTPSDSIVREEPTVYLPVIPLRSTMGEPSLTEAAENHDYETFHSQYILAKARGERVGQFDALHELWSWSMSSPTGAFYGPDLHDRIAAAYPGFASYIDEYRIIDRNGNVFYPTAETRTFLLEQAMRNNTAPRVQIARGETSAPTITPRTTGGAAPLAPSRSRARTRMQKADAGAGSSVPRVPRGSSGAVAVAEKAPAPVPAEAPRGTEELRGTEGPRGTASAEPAPALASLAPAPVKPIVPASTNRTSGRATLMIIIGLLGAGILAVLLRAPKEEPLTVLPAVQPKAQGDVAKVEPIRKPESVEGQTPQQQTPPQNAKKTPSRANGSRR